MLSLCYSRRWLLAAPLTGLAQSATHYHPRCRSLRMRPRWWNPEFRVGTPSTNRPQLLAPSGGHNSSTLCPPKAGATERRDALRQKVVSCVPTKSVWRVVFQHVIPLLLKAVTFGCSVNRPRPVRHSLSPSVSQLAHATTMVEPRVQSGHTVNKPTPAPGPIRRSQFLYPLSPESWGYRATRRAPTKSSVLRPNKVGVKGGFPACYPSATQGGDFWLLR